MTAPIQVRCIDHVTLVVKDLEVSRRFYVDLIGMDEVSRPAFSFPGLWFRAGKTLIHLIGEHDESGPGGYPDEVTRTNTRQHHLAFAVDDASAVADVLKHRDVPLVSDLKTRPDGAAQVFAYDPDGHIVEFCSE